MSQPVSSQTTTVTTLPPKPSQKGSWEHMAVEVIAGGTGGAVGMTASTPFMYFKMYFQERAKDRQKAPPFQKNPVKWFAGAPGLSAWMFPQTAFNFTMNNYLRKQVAGQEQRELTSFEKLYCSATTGALSAVFVAPQELIWTQQKKAAAKREKLIQENKLDPKQVPQKNAVQVAREIAKEYGVKGFYRAGGETTFREMCSTIVLTQLANEHPILAPVIGATISQPLDTRKTYKQLDFHYKAPLKEIFSRAALSGLLMGRIPVYLVFMNVTPTVYQQVTKALKQD